MITISLDESSGVFESFVTYNKKHEKDVPLVAGLIFDDLGIAGELEEEKKRIKTFLKGICDDLSIEFPNDMHVNRGTRWGDQDYNGDKVGSFKGRIINDIFLFFKLDRKGRYYVYSNIKSLKGKTNLIGLPDGFVDDAYFSNLYIHMVEDVFSKIVLYNPLFTNNTSVSISFASRSTPKLNDDQKDDYRSVGYNIRDKDKVAYVGTGDVYRTSLNREIIASGKKNIKIDSFNVVSIDYGYRSSSDKKTKQPLTDEEVIDQGFLYLADIICDYFGYGLSVDDSNIIETIADRAEKLVPADQTIIFGYDDIESEFMRSWVFTENGDLYKALDCAYDALRSKGQFTDYYEKRWYPVLFQKMSDEITQNTFEIAVKSFGNSAHSNNVDSNKLRFIYEHLEKIVKTLKRSSSEVLYELFDTGFSAFNHVGDSNKAEACFEECKKYSSEVGIERYFNTMNKYVVSLQDRFRYDEALEYASECEAAQSRIHDALEDKYSNIAVKNYAKTISQLGQVYASLRNTKATEKFKEALFLLQKNTADYYITESYLLHHLIDMGERDEYEKYADDYYAGHPVEERLDFIFESGRAGVRFSLSFAMYIHIRAVYTFYMNEVSDDYIESLLNNEYFIDSKNKDSHPWELIYKYLALIALSKGDNSKFVKYWDYSKFPYEKSEKIVRAIVIHNNIELMEEAGVGDVEEEWKKLESIVCEDMGASFIKSREDINHAFTYMYR